MIRMKIRTWGGGEWDGVLLWLCGATMRVAVTGSDDVTELYCHGDQWFSENGDPVQIGFHAQPLGRGVAATGTPACGQWVN